MSLIPNRCCFLLVVLGSLPSRFSFHVDVHELFHQLSGFFSCCTVDSDGCSTDDDASLISFAIRSNMAHGDTRAVVNALRKSISANERSVAAGSVVCGNCGKLKMATGMFQS